MAVKIYLQILLYLKSFWTSKESCMGDITKTFDNHLHKAWNNLIESLQTYKPLNGADGGGAGSIFDQARSKQAVE